MLTSRTQMQDTLIPRLIEMWEIRRVVHNDSFENEADEGYHINDQSDDWWLYPM